MVALCTFRRAGLADVQNILRFGRSIPELQVSADADFMSHDEMASAVSNPNGVFILAEREGELVGFGYANCRDPDRPAVAAQACLVHLAVNKDCRKSGIGNELYGRVMEELRSCGINYVYAWANPTSGVIEFMENKGWAKGHAYVWMDKKL